MATYEYTDTNRILDRGLHKQASRDSIYFDSNNTYKYFAGRFEHDFGAGDVEVLGELDYRIINNVYLEAAHQERIFQKIMSDYSDLSHINALYVYSEVKSGGKLTQILKEIGYE